jgi:acyl-CoA reductase-like NAD-dependent aldehyde dehydrogenase
LEHGGVAPAIVDRSANLDALIELMVKGGYYHAGQVCVSVQRIYVHSTLMPAFLDRFVARVRALRVGDPLSPETEVGPLINEREVDRVESWVTGCRRAKILAEQSAHRRRSWSRRSCSNLGRTHECREKKYSAP